MQMDGEDLRPLPLTERRRRPAGSPALQTRLNIALLSAAYGMGLEGVVSKFRDQPYKSGENRGRVTSTSYSRNSEG